MPTFLHTADIHLDSKFSARLDSRKARERRGDVRCCVSNMADMAKDLDFWLIAGDLFENSKKVSQETIAFLNRVFAKIPDTQIIIAAGNHDPYTEGSVYAEIKTNENVHILSTGGEILEFPKLSTRIFGRSFNEERCEETLSVPKIEKRDGICDILVLHGDISSESPYNPISPEFIKDSNADYAALGHIHKRSEVKKIGNTYYAYCGAPEGHGFDECGELGCYIGEIKDGSVRCEFKRTCIRRMYKEYIDISEVSDSIEATDIIKTAITKIGNADDMYRLALKGRVNPYAINFEIINAELEKCLYHVEMTDMTEPDFDIDAIKEQNNICGKFVRYILDLPEIDAEAKEAAVKIGLEALIRGDAK